MGSADLSRPEYTGTKRPCHSEAHRPKNLCAAGAICGYGRKILRFAQDDISRLPSAAFAVLLTNVSGGHKTRPYAKLNF